MWPKLSVGISARKHRKLFNNGPIWTKVLKLTLVTAFTSIIYSKHFQKFENQSWFFNEVQQHIHYKFSMCTVLCRLIQRQCSIGKTIYDTIKSIKVKTLNTKREEWEEISVFPQELINLEEEVILIIKHYKAQRSRNRI